MLDTALSSIADTAEQLKLDDDRLAGGDQVSDELRSIRLQFASLPDDEPWLRAWLEGEHFRLAALFTAARTNYKKWSGSSNAAAEAARDSAVSLFHSARSHLSTRIRVYQSSDRSAKIVEPWVSELRSFIESPKSPGT